MRRQLVIPSVVAVLALVLVAVTSELREPGSEAVTIDRTSADTAIAGSEPRQPSVDDADGADATPSTAARPRSSATEPGATDASSPGAVSGSDPDPLADAPQGAQTPAAASPPVAAPSATAAPPPEAVSGIEGYRLRVPSLGISASMNDFGVDGEGVMEVPLEAQTVAWYRFTALPGEPGNILLGGHITWRGATAVFRYLEEMSNGDEILIDTPSGETIRYVVRQTWWADPYDIADVRQVVGSRSGQESITLFTCGGVWDTEAREYSHRRVVTAYRV